MNTTRRIRTAALAAACFGCFAGAAGAGQNPPSYSGPTPYTSLADSPFDFPAVGSCYEDFEGASFGIPGATGNGSVIAPSGITDSVDGDDGNVDGSGTGGYSYFSGNGTAGITITFSEGRNEGLPRNVGIVWTDGGAGAAVTFEAFDKDDASILKDAWGPFAIGDGSNNGTTVEDSYFSAFHPDGISRVTISNNSGGIEVDHIQLDRCFICGDTNFDSKLKASDALTALRASVGSGACITCVCDTNGNGQTTSSDALAILRSSVGLSTTMSCNECGVIV
jgi:hypothetical protein